MKRNLFLILSNLLLPVGLILLAYASVLFFYPKNAVKMKPFPKEIGVWDKERICSRTEPSPLFINFYGNKKEEWIAIILGRDTEFARLFIVPMTKNGKNTITYAITKDGPKQITMLDAAETEEYLNKFNFTPEEDLFFRYCIYKVFPAYWDPHLPAA